MKVFDLVCDRAHRFEGWFASAQHYVDQRAQGLLECPVCGSRGIQKLLSAPRLNLSASLGVPEPASDGAGQADREASMATLRGLHELVKKVAAVLIEHTEDVGTRFVSEVRRIHEGQADDRPIRGVASLAETERLRDDGIEVFVLPVPDGVGGSIH
jgi:hypothetical protein